MDDVLRSAPLFSALDDEAANALRASMVEVHLDRGQVLFREGDRGDRLYVVVAGKVKLRRTSVDGRENVLAIIGPGEMFGELSIFDPGPRSSTAAAITDLSLLELGQAEVRA
ncbi:MAG: cyclic nucleotide-binding domain-containing protein, partial [Sporichthyaceae bacterium]|nr:cyclic nucleotide-binding domain-containing protein [Sporichthyaceae bacterium]